MARIGAVQCRMFAVVDGLKEGRVPHKYIRLLSKVCNFDIRFLQLVLEVELRRSKSPVVFS
jgi:hypothetical protein